MKTPNPKKFKEIEEIALKQFPDKKLEWTAIDINAFQRYAFMEGYLQAQTDILNSMSNL